MDPIFKRLRSIACHNIAIHLLWPSRVVFKLLQGGALPPESDEKDGDGAGDAEERAESKRESGEEI